MNIILVMQSTGASIIVGSQVWVEDHDVAWIDGEGLEINDKEIKVKCSSGKEVSFSSIVSISSTKQ